MRKLKSLSIEGTGKTPQIEFNHLTGGLILSGRSIPENATRTYEPLLVWIKSYIKSPHHTTNLHLNLEYFNVSSLRWIAKMIRGLSKIEQKDASLFIHLYFDIEEYGSNDAAELKEILSFLIINCKVNIRIGIKTYGTSEDGKIIKVSTILI